MGDDAETLRLLRTALFRVVTKGNPAYPKGRDYGLTDPRKARRRKP